MTNNAMLKNPIRNALFSRALTAAVLAGLLAAVWIPSPGRAFETAAREAILVDMETDRVLFAKNADTRMPPASMSKLMTVYMVFERLQEGTLSLDDTFRVSENAWRRGGAKSGSSTMFLEPGERVSVEDLLRGIIVQSGNDACIVMAEGLAGSEAAFAEQMTRKAQELGLEDSHFVNATGWPDPDQYMTAHDLARLAERTIRDFPDYYHYYAEREFTHNDIRQFNRNPLLDEGIGVDGLKTGHTEDAGHGLTASARRGERRLILVVTGLDTKKAREAESRRLLEWGFREFDNYALFKKGDVVEEAEVWLGEEARVPLIIDRDLTVTLPRRLRPDMTVTVRYEAPVPAPIEKGTRLAQLVVSVPEEEDRIIPLLAGTDVGALGLIGRIGAAVNYLVWGEFH